MAILELGINLGMKSLVENKYYSSSDNILNPEIRARLLVGIEEFISEVFGDEINVISLSNFEIICYYEMVHIASKKTDESLPLLTFAIIEKGTNHNFVKKHLQEITTRFLKHFNLNDVFVKTSKHFKVFEPVIDEILGDLRFSMEDRISTIFKD
ncbi:MAG: hypothetical protein ACFFAG_17295 [Promethearchaeota archaeon]